MKSTSTIVAAVVLFGAASVLATDPVYKGCYSKVPDFTFNTTYKFNTQGFCSLQCGPVDAATLATTKGTDCWCGSTYPPDADLVDDSFCNSICPGFGTIMCGGTSYFSVWLTGITTDATTQSNTTDSDSSSTTQPASTSPTATTSSKPSTITVGGQTVVVTASGDASNSASAVPKSSGGASVAGIAAGVVVGVVAIAAIAGGTFLFIRNKKRREVEEEYRRNAAVSSFIAGGGKPPNSSGGNSSFTDTRLEPSVMAQRRMSDGSIADNQDYSRRILKVTNA